MGKKRGLFFILLSLLPIAGIIILLCVGYYNDARDYKTTLSGMQTVARSVYSAPEGSTQRILSSIDAEPTGLQADETEQSEKEQTVKEAREQLKDSNRVNILFLGIDKTEEREDWLGVYRTDTIALASINLDTRKIEVLCIPRDTYTYLPVVDKMDKINHAYAFGGMNEKGISKTLEVVNQFIKYSTVDYYFSLDMEPIPKIVDSVGGVELDVEIDMLTYGANLFKGKQLLNGQQAFDYIHWRFSGNGDIDRIFRQQKFTKAMFNKLKEKDQLITAVKLVLDYSKNIKTNMTTKQILALAILLNDSTPEDIQFSTVPGSGQYIDGISYWVPDNAQTEEVLKKCFELTRN